MTVGIIGAGISGLTAGYRLWRAGIPVRVLECETQPGGRMRTRRDLRFPVDLGTNLLLANYDHLRGLNQELGLVDDWQAFEAGYGGILRDGCLTSFTPSGLRDILRYRGLSPLSRVRLALYMLELSLRDPDLEFYDLGRGNDRREAVDAGSFTRRWLGTEVLDYLVDPFVRTFQFHSPSRLSMRYLDALSVLLLRRGGFVPHGYRHFMSELPDALARHLPVRYGQRVRRVRPRGGWVAVQTEEGVERFDSVILAVPAPRALELLDEPGPGLRDFLARVRYSSTLSCSFVVPRTRSWDFESIWIPHVQSATISECTNETCKGDADDKDCVLNICLHEEAAERWMAEDDERVFDAVAAEWARLFPGMGSSMKPLNLQRWPLAMPIYGPGLVPAARQYWETMAGVDGLHLCGDYLNHPWVEGSVRCGERVAQQILDIRDSRSSLLSGTA